METSRRSQNALSLSAKWLYGTLEIFDGEHIAIEQTYLRCLPNKLIDRIAIFFQTHWETLSNQTNTLLATLGKDIKIVDASSLLEEASSPTSHLRIEDLYKLLKPQSHLNRTLKASLTEIIYYKDQDEHIFFEEEKSRIKSSQDTSKGKISELSNETLSKLSELIEGDNRWKLLTDGLGIKTHSKPLAAKDLLSEWLKKAPNATLSHLLFETSILNMEKVALFLKGINLKPKQSNLIIPLNQRIVTLFDTTKLNKVYDELEVYSSPCDQLLADAWKTGNYVMQQLLRALKEESSLAYGAKKFKKMLSLGHFEPRSPGGIALTEIYQLSQSISKPEKPLGTGAMGVIDSARYRYAIGNLETQLKLKNFSCATLQEVLYIYWQTEGQNLDLKTFCISFRNAINTVSTLADSGIAKKFWDCYLKICPSYIYIEPAETANKGDAATLQTGIESSLQVKPDSHLPALTLEQSINSLAQRELSNSKLENGKKLCVLCDERPRKIALMPCGHYGFCLKCIANTPTCSVCKSKITSSVEIFEL